MLSAWIVVWLCGFLDAGQATPGMADNAALEYWQGFGAMPDSLSEAERQALEKWQTAPLTSLESGHRNQFRHARDSGKRSLFPPDISDYDGTSTVRRVVKS